MVLSILAGATPWAAKPADTVGETPDKPISAKAVQARRRLDERAHRRQNTVNSATDQMHTEKATIQPGDTLSQIAHEHGTSVASLQAAVQSHISKPDLIYAGDASSLPPRETPEYQPMEDEHAVGEHPDIGEPAQALSPAIEAFGPSPLYSQFTGETNQASTTHSTNSNSLLLSKLDHLISLLDIQEGERAGNETEEIILYLFLGVFIIYVIDSFSKVAKYTR